VRHAPVMSLTTLAQAVVGGLASGAAHALLALPFAIVFGLARVLNLAHGELVVLGGYAAYAAWRAWGLPLPALALLAGLALVPLGLLWRALLARVPEPLALNSLTLTFGLSLLLQNGTVLAWSADYRLIPVEAGRVGPALLGLSPERAGLAAASLMIFLALHLGLARTRGGTALRATSQDPETAALMGVDTDRVARIAFAAAAAVAGSAGAVFATIHYLHPAAGVDLTLLAITLALLGGTGRIGGLLVAGLGLGLAEGLAMAVLGPRWRELTVTLALLGALLVRSRGLRAGRPSA
jgi:branched-chain amino acid transport system permease protein